jgi:DNA-binding transcriptional MerR regulator
MKGYSTGEVELLLGLPASTLRFWEREVAFLAPRKDVFGRRLYSSLDLCILARLKHLALDRGLGLKTAKEVMERELLSGDQDMKADINALRIDLLALAERSEGILKDPFLGFASGTNGAAQSPGEDHGIDKESL